MIIHTFRNVDGWCKQVSVSCLVSSLISVAHSSTVPPLEQESISGRRTKI